ncbi:MFS transporter [Advenella sp. S44]|uniref:Bug family tripartite tricarboxylate transporter substrate binding protein n=1 Tax=Advenella sp. S44 TaxID=1982755 RepID=UPI000C2B4CA7|nr:tripartite tricarboxylate transporter substrate binding protein [Advenella sp. S44]PJX25566.1 MFS transporter [Advenella sp. S44]
MNLISRGFFPRAFSIVAGLGMLAAVSSVSAQEEAYPSKPVTVLVGFAAGGTTDVLARIVAKGLGDELNESFVVENKLGAGSNIATDQLLRRKPDGYTLMMMAVTTTINQTLYKNARFNIEKDIDPIVLVAKVPNILVASSKTPYNNVKEFVDYAKANPGKVNYGSSGAGTSIHLAGELFKQQADIDMLHIPFSGSGPSMTALVGGQTDVVFENMPAAVPQIKAGKIKAFAVTTDKRSDAFPDVPTLQESGYPQFNVSSWFGLVAPKGTPKPIIDKINATVEKILAKPEVIEQLASLGATAEKNTPEEFSKFVADETHTWGEVIRKGNISID